MIGIAAVFGAVAIFVADIWVKSAASARVQEMAAPEAAVPAVQFRTIVVAAQPLRFGMELDRAQLAELPWPQEALPEGAFATIDELLAEGRAVLAPIAPNEPVLLAKLSGPNGRATLSNMMTPGMRAVTIKTDEVAGVGGFIMPGDRVDIVLTRDAGAVEEVSEVAAGAAGSTLTSEVVLEDVKVLSVGQAADMSQTDPQVANSVTVEVTTEGAKKIALARSIGALSLSLRSARSKDDGAGGLTTIKSFGGTVAAGAAEQPKGFFEDIAEPEGPRMKTVVVTRGTEPQTYQVVAPQN